MIERLSSFLQRFPRPGIYFVFPGRGDKSKEKKEKEAEVKPDPAPKPVPKKKTKTKRLDEIIKDKPALLVDTSALIDGRLADIAETGFISGTLVVPDFIVDELHKVADSKDSLKRNRGRQGLDVLQAIKKNKYTKFLLYKGNGTDSKGPVDKRLLELGKKMKGRVITTDYNLNKVGKVSNVPILNVNELANMVKTIVLPGEEFVVELIEEGKEKKQAVGYLPDGTMVVVDGGKKLLGEKVQVRVDRLWQTDAGRMIFAKPISE